MDFRCLFIALLCVTFCKSTQLFFSDCNGSFMTGKLRRCCKSEYLLKGCLCFDITKDSGFTNTIFKKPKCPSIIDIKFYFYDRRNPTKGLGIKGDQENITASTFQGDRRTFVLTHGFTDFAPSPWMVDMKDALLAEEDMNVILVDWRNGARPKKMKYYQAVANTRIVGAMIGKLLLDLNSFTSATFDSFHLAGHSLGAHVMAYASNEVFRSTQKKVGRITGLDPAGLAFDNYGLNVRLDKEDATFVVVIHTDAETLSDKAFGTCISMGHVDFYPNEGKRQPGCPDKSKGIRLLETIAFEKVINAAACSHSRALRLFTNSISKCRYDPPGGGNQLCTMGYHTDPSCRGEFKPTTTSEQPFCNPPQQKTATMSTPNEAL